MPRSAGSRRRDRDNDDNKLIPGWSVSADGQIIVLGVLVTATLVIGFMVWPGFWVDDPVTGVVAPLRERSSASAQSSSGREPAAPTTTTSAPTTAQTNPEAVDLTPDVSAAVSSFDGITGTANGTIATLDGFVGTDIESQQAEAAALAVPGITGVDNRLTVLESTVRDAATSAGVGDAVVRMDGTSATLRGLVANDVEAAAAVAAAEAVEGITPPVTSELRILQPEVQAAMEEAAEIDAPEAIVETELDQDPVVRVATLRGEVGSEEARTAIQEAVRSVPGIDRIDNQVNVVGPSGEEVTSSLNQLFELNPIQFRSGSDVILDESLPTLDQAVSILRDAPAEVRLEVQGYTDTTGGTEANQRLSDRRAAAVRSYLVEGGVPDGILTSQGYGETTQFGPELADNRRVRFELL